MHYIFLFILLLHGMIHLMGFAKAFRYAEISELRLPVSRAWGSAWLVAALLFVASGMLFLVQREIWWVAAIPAVLLSQVLIFQFWRDAKFGSAVNVILLVAIVFAWAGWQFDSRLQQELRHFLAQQGPEVEQPLTADQLTGLPPIVQTWLKRSNSIGKPLVQVVKLRQEGRMRTAPDNRWMPFGAWQYVTVRQPGFFWVVEAQAAPGIRIAGRDMYEAGKGYMLIKALQLIPVADASGPHMDQGAMVRYLAEMIWYPGAALAEYIRWEAVDSLSARATMRYGRVEASGVFTFTPEGDPDRFEAMRYYDRKDGATLEKWLIRMDPDGFRDFNDIRLPARSTVSWDLKDGIFEWLELDITQLEYIKEGP
ncbi:MAG: hypothetical protein EP344_15925 [Bacteroidetes bacterium]|nr:MAG: hypothetical protein EP344_15925 [Bacteroidota bacterium]